MFLGHPATAPKTVQRAVRGTAGILAAGLLATALLAAGGEAAAQERLQGELAACRMLEDPTERLRCYDALAGSEAEAGEVAAEEGAMLLELAGEDDFDSEAFVPEGDWHLRWESEGSILTVELRDATGELVAIIGNQIGRGEDRSPEQPPGEYSLAVRAIGAWRLWVIEER